jgi:hypothetical protein
MPHKQKRCCVMVAVTRLSVRSIMAARACVCGGDPVVQEACSAALRVMYCI